MRNFYTTKSKTLIISFFVILFGFEVNAQNQKIFGRILSSNGDGLEDITIVAPQKSILSGEEGNFQFEEEMPLPVLLHVYADGFFPVDYQVTSENYDPAKGVVISLNATDEMLDEIVITTGRRNNSYLTNTTELGGKFSGSLKDLPQSVSMVTREFMEDRGASTITDMIADMAGVNQASSYDDFTVRGFSNGYGNLRLVNGMRSGYGYSDSYFHAPLTANLESIEILKGPGASLFGDIAPGGTVNLVTKKPLEEQKSTVNFSVGSFQTLRSSLDIGGPLDKDKKVLYRLNVAYDNARTFRDNNKHKELMIAPSFTFRPADGTQIDVDLVYDNFDGYLDRGMGIRNKDFYALDRSFNVNQPTDFFRTKYFTFTTRFTQDLAKDLKLHLNYMKSVFKEDLDELRTLNTFADAPTNTIMNMRFLSKNVTE